MSPSAPHAAEPPCAGRLNAPWRQFPLARDLLDGGVVLAGGGSLLRGIDRVIAREVGLPVRIAEEPLFAVARGTAAVLEELEKLAPVLESSRDL